jgi:hypothetical protein
MLPMPIPPPRTISRSMFEAASGCSASSVAMLVSGPMATMVTGPADSRSTAAITVTA